MNRLGAKSNTGEGGEEPQSASSPMPNGDSNALRHQAGRLRPLRRDELELPDQQPTMIQIKMAQGAKPGEGGQLPGHKV